MRLNVPQESASLPFTEGVRCGARGVHQVGVVVVSGASPGQGGGWEFWGVGGGWVGGEVSFCYGLMLCRAHMMMTNAAVMMTNVCLMVSMRFWGPSLVAY